MNQSIAESEYLAKVRLTGAVVTGLGMGAGMLVVRAFPPPTTAALFLSPIVFAVFLNAFVLLKWRKASTLGFALLHEVMVVFAVLVAATVSMFVTASSGGLARFFEDSRVVNTWEFHAFVASVASLAGWLAFLYSRFIERFPEVGAAKPTKREPGPWAAAGITLFLLFFTLPSWTLAVYSVLPTLGPSRFGYVMNAAFGAIVGASSLVTGIVVELVRGRRRSRAEIHD